MADEAVTLQRFLFALTDRLAALPTEQLRAVLLAHATTLPPRDRAGFLDLFAAPVPAGSAHLENVDAVDDELLADIEDFVSKVASGAYYQGYGWDDALHDQRSFGDESWVFEMDGLFEGAQQAFLSGQFGLAQAAYRQLFDAFDLDQEVGTFCGPESAVEMVATDVPEVEARYLRTVYETTPAAERADELAQEWFNLPSYRNLPTLRAVREVLPDELADVEDFVPQWITALKGLRTDPKVRRLLSEAVESFRGVDGLGESAREAGPGQAERHADWIAALLRTGRNADAAAAAREALGVLPSGGEVRAGIADQLADLMDDDTAAVLRARREAWRAAPTQDRLVGLHHAASVADAPEQVLGAELDQLTTDPMPPRLLAAALLLAGRADDAVDLLTESSTGNPRTAAVRVLLPYLLAAACAGPTHDGWAGTRAARLLSGVDDPQAWNWTTTPADVPATSCPSLSALLADRIVHVPEPPERRMVLLEAARRAIENEVDAAVVGQHRARYAEMAHLVACGAEALRLEEDDRSARTYIRMVRDRYPRHAAFRRELGRALSDEFSEVR